jgi:uncharacterized cupredoxin-like copper-binding protein
MHPVGLAAALAVMVALALAAPERLHAHDASPHQGHDTPQFSAGEPGNPKRAAKVIEITMNEADGKMGFKPDKIEVRRGEQVRFVLKNAGALDHEFMLATRAENAKHAELMQKYPDMEHDDPNGTRIKSNAKGEILWRFTRRGEFEFACLIPGHYEAGMLGKVIVK